MCISRIGVKRTANPVGVRSQEVGVQDQWQHYFSLVCLAGDLDCISYIDVQVSHDVRPGLGRTETISMNNKMDKEWSS